MSHPRGKDLLRCCVVLVFLGTGSFGLPNRTGAVRLTQYETIDSNNMNQFNSKDTLEINNSNTELIPKLHDNSSTVRRWHALGSGGEIGPLCAYRTLGAGDPGRLCFRYTQPDFRCPSTSCRQVRAPGGQLTANILSNNSVFIQWSVSETTGQHGPGHTPGDSTASPKSPKLGQQGQLGGFRLSCWWNGSYTQFECAGVHLGSSCRDYLLNELHTNVPYRLCLRPYAPDQAEVCVEFSLVPSGMQDIVIAMTTVGGAICVMLVIICLLVAYITENIMNPTAQHTLTSPHSHRSHTHTHL